MVKNEGRLRRGASGGVILLVRVMVVYFGDFLLRPPWLIPADGAASSWNCAQKVQRSIPHVAQWLVLRRHLRGGAKEDRQKQELGERDQDVLSADAAEDNNLDSWLAGWQKGPIEDAGKRKRADEPKAVEEKTSVKVRRVAGDDTAAKMAVADKSGSSIVKPGNVGDSDEDLEAAMREVAREQRARSEGKGGSSTGEEEKAAKGHQKRREKTGPTAEKWPAEPKERRKTETQLTLEDADFLKKVKTLEDEVGGARGLFTQGNITEEFTVPDYDLLEPGIRPPLQYLFNRSEWMAEPELYEWDPYRCPHETISCAFPTNHSLITRHNDISVRVETHPRRKDEVHVRPTKPDVYYALNHELLENPRGVRWEVNLTGLPQNVSLAEIREILRKARETDIEYKSDVERRRRYSVYVLY